MGGGGLPSPLAGSILRVVGGEVGQHTFVNLGVFHIGILRQLAGKCRHFLAVQGLVNVQYMGLLGHGLQVVQRHGFLSQHLHATRYIQRADVVAGTVRGKACRRRCFEFHNQPLEVRRWHGQLCRAGAALSVCGPWLQPALRLRGGDPGSPQPSKRCNGPYQYFPGAHVAGLHGFRIRRSASTWATSGRARRAWITFEEAWLRCGCTA